MLSRLIVSDHAAKRMAEQRIDLKDVKTILQKGEVIRIYPEDRPYESRLILGFVSGRPLHVVAADADHIDATFVITVYRPNPDLWKQDFKTKKRDEQE